MGWMNDFLEYMRYDPVYRGAHHDELTFSMIYAYSERFLLSLSHDEVVHGKGTLFSKMPGTPEQKLANLRLAYGYMTAHPGKKLLFMGQEFGQEPEWSEKAGLDWKELKEEGHACLREYTKALLKLYRSHPALYSLDSSPDGFEWINCLEWEKNLLLFLRKTEKEEDTLLVVCNFSNVEYDDFLIGVPFPGKYKEIFNSDAREFGGSGVTNPRVKISRKKEWDERENSIKVKIPPLGISVYQYTKAIEKLADNRTAKKGRKAPARTDGLKKELEDKFIKEEKR
jgi:1,4-alpha-glucan branching enzyme